MGGRRRLGRNCGCGEVAILLLKSEARCMPKDLFRRHGKLRAVKTLGESDSEPTSLSLRQGTRRRCFYLTQFPLPVLHLLGIHLQALFKNGE